MALDAPDAPPQPMSLKDALALIASRLEAPLPWDWSHSDRLALREAWHVAEPHVNSLSTGRSLIVIPQVGERKGRAELGADRFMLICESYAELGAANRACELHGFSYETVKSAMRDQSVAGDDTWKEAWLLAKEKYREGLELEARSRAVDGWREPIVSKGEIVGYVTRKSDRLLEMLMAGNMPEKYGRAARGSDVHNTLPAQSTGLPDLGDGVQLSFKAKKAIRDIIMADIAEQAELQRGGAEVIDA